MPDLMNADVILNMGSNMAENHRIGFQRVMEAKEPGAKLIHVDPRFSRTSAVVDIWATDATLCIGCKACEVACKERNQVQADGYTFTGNSYDNTASLG